MTEPTTVSRDLTRWLADWRRGDAAAGERMIQAVYPELNRMAAAYLAGERAENRRSIARNGRNRHRP